MTYLNLNQNHYRFIVSINRSRAFNLIGESPKSIDIIFIVYYVTTHAVNHHLITKNILQNIVCVIFIRIYN